MNSRPEFYYLFDKDDGIEIVKMTDTEASKFWDQGRHWREMPQKTMADAEELRTALLKTKVVPVKR